VGWPGTLDPGHTAGLVAGQVYPAVLLAAIPRTGHGGREQRRATTEKAHAFALMYPCCGGRRFRHQPGCPIRRRNEAVVRNLPLAHHVAERYLRASGCRGGATAEDVHAAACAGLVRCLDRFDPSQGHRLSSYAVPFISGAIRQHLRDHWMPLKVPRRLLELQQRGLRLQNRRIRQGLPPLPPDALAAQLGTSSERLEEAGRAWLLLRRVESLDALDGEIWDGG
jgi:RNA polymerase sigma factor (sigma-70 family)